MGNDVICVDVDQNKISKLKGIAPNRMFIVTWCAIPMFSCTSDLHTSQLVLYEGSC